MRFGGKRLIAAETAMTLHHLTMDHLTDDALMSRLYELARSDRQTVETAQIDAEV